MSETASIGLIGTGVMGRNLALNLADHGHPVAVYNRTFDPVEVLVAENPGLPLLACRTLEEMVARLERPRRVLMMVPAGAAVDQVIASVTPVLDDGDVLIDGGNSWFEDTRRREQALRDQGLRFFGVGVSGGEEGARHGPSLMPGGDAQGYEALREMLESIAARTDSGPCVTHVGPDGAGHFVKMVHNGIEYADMQLIAESYDLMARGLSCDAAQLARTFGRWNEGPLGSFLIEITARIFEVEDAETGRPLVDLVLDRAGQKGTGRWTARVALELGVPVPSIAAAVDARVLSSRKSERVTASGALSPAVLPAGSLPVEVVHDGLYAAKVCAYAQGMDLIRTASKEYGWNVQLREMARIWKGGCIIRARLLDAIMQAYDEQPDLPNLLLARGLGGAVVEHQQALRQVVSHATKLGVPLPGHAASLAYFDSYRTADLPQNLTQAQRDAFGAHTYVRKDRPDAGAVHTDWL